MLAVVLALAAAVGFGGSDFAAGLAARGASVIRVTIVAQATTVILAVLIVPWVGARHLSLASAAWGVGAGVSGVAGAMALYLGFRHAAFSVASSLSAVSTAGLSVLAGLLLGERPGWLSLAGISLALPAIAVVSASPGQAQPASRGQPQAASTGQAQAARRGQPRSASRGEPEPGGARVSPLPVPDPVAGGTGGAPTGRHLTGVMYGLAAGACFALYFVGLSRAGSAAGLWPVLVAEVAALATAAAIGAVTGQLRLPSARTLPLAALTGAAGMAGTICFFLATHAGLLAVTAVITSLYPAGTILLARALLGERLTPARLAGLGLAAASVALIAVGGTA